jgi:DNA-3-methyladenine glycosylase
VTGARARSLGERRALDRGALERPAPDASRWLLGKLLVRVEDDGAETVVRIIETEAYREDDPASHAYRGPRPSTAAMFGPAGHAYVYFTYGMHWCMNVSCEEDGVGAAVLLRAGLVLEGEPLVRARRGDHHPPRDLLRGPARLTQGLGIARETDGLDLLDPAAPVRLEADGWEPAGGAIASGPRIGVRTAPDVAWRFWVADLPEVSRYTRHPRAEPPPTP